MKNSSHPVDIRKGFKPQRDWGVFIDRDGVINEERHLVYKIKDFKIYPFVFKAIKKLNKHNIPVIIHHNASVIARGICSVKKVIKIYEYLKSQLDKKGAFLDVILFCPHHPTAYDKKMILNCSWRKPKAGMLNYVKKLFGLNLKKSYVVGDAARDILMGQAVGAKTILVKTGHAGKDEVYQAKPDFVLKDLKKAVDFIIKKEKL